MKFKTAKRIYIIGTLLELALLCVVGLIGDTRAAPWLAGLLVLLVVNAIFSVRYLRCPHCGSLLNRVAFINCCPHCGEELEQEPKGGDFK